MKKIKDFYYQKKAEIDLFFSQIIYKNRVGYALNKKGLARWRVNRKLSPVLKKENFPLGYQFFQIENKELLETIRLKYEKIIEDPVHSFILDSENNLCPDRPDNGVFFLLKNIMLSIPEVLELINSKEKKLLYDYYGCNFRLLHVAAYRTKNLKLGTDTMEVYAHKFHYDRHPVDNVKMFISLQDIEQKHGPLTFFDRLNSKILLKKGYRERHSYGKARELLEKSGKQLSLTGKKGTGVICDTTTCLHRAGIPLAGEKRDLLLLLFESAAEQFDWTKKEEKMLIINEINRGYSHIK